MRCSINWNIHRTNSVINESFMNIQASFDQMISTQISLFEGMMKGYRERNLKIFVSTSLQTHSIPLLHLISKMDKDVAVYFLDTGFHFPETLEYLRIIEDFLEMPIVRLKSSMSKISQMDREGRFFYVSEPDYCCYLNKVAPLEPVTAEYDIWISGVRRDQTATRSNFTLEAAGSNGVTRFHPMLDWDKRMIWHYIKQHDIPRHPLDAKGYVSVSCAPCTARIDFAAEDERQGRWAGLKKTECGLHTTMIK